MKIQHYKIFFLFFVSIFLFIGCGSSDDNSDKSSDNLKYPGPGGGEILSVDKNGHFKKDITYNTGTMIATFKKDGTFVEENYHYDDTAGKNVQYFGQAGTYSYNLKKLTMTWTNLRSYSENNGWKDLPSYVSDIHTRTVFYCEHSVGRVYFSDGDSWTMTWTENYTDSNNSSNNYSRIEKETFYLKDGVGGYKYTDICSRTNSQGTSYDTYINKETGDVSIYPSGTEFKKGKTVTFLVSFTSNVEQNWDDDTNQLGPEENNDLGYSRYTFTNNGGYIVFYPEDAYRGNFGQ